MNDVCKEYALSIFELAGESNSQAEYLEALKQIDVQFNNLPEYIALLDSPNVSADERCELFEAAFVSSVPEQVLSFVEILIRRNHIRSFHDCVREYEALFSKANKLVHAQLISAVPLTEGEKEKLLPKLQELSGGRIEPEYIVDKSIIGGIIIKLNDKFIDGSLRRRLSELKEVISNEQS